MSGLTEKEEREHDKERDQDRDTVEHVAEETGHDDAGAFSNALNHEVGAIANIGVRPHEDGTGGDGDEERIRWQRRAGVQGDRCFEEDRIRGSVIKEARKHTGRPKELPGLGNPQFAPTGLQNLEGGHHADEYANKQEGYLADSSEVELVPGPDPFGSGDPTESCEQEHHRFTQVGWNDPIGVH
jgi:hypothetical protein